MKYGIIIFDFDGTIADTSKSILLSMQMVAKELGVEIDEKQLQRLIGLPLRTSFEEVFNLETEMIEDAMLLYREYYRLHASSVIRLFPLVKETLVKLLNKGYVLAIASNKGKKALVEILKSHDIYSNFSFIGGEEDVINKKPSPDIINLILSELRYNPKDCLVVGDTIFDVEMGKRAFVDTCFVTYGNGDKNEILGLKPDFIIDEFISILDFI